MCDLLTGKCINCIHNTTGFNCEKCLIGFWGNAIQPQSTFSTSILSESAYNYDFGCKACDCFELGTVQTSFNILNKSLLECRKSDGQCECKPHVIGQRCDKCEVILK